MPEGDEPEGLAWPIPELPAPRARAPEVAQARTLDSAQTLIPVPSLESMTPPAIAPPEPTSKEPPPPEPVAREPVLLERSAMKEIASPTPGPPPASEQPATERLAPEPPAPALLAREQPSAPAGEAPAGSPAEAEPSLPAAPVPRPAAPSPPSASTGGPGDGIERASPLSQPVPGETPRQRAEGAPAGVAQASPEPGGRGVGHAPAASSAAPAAGAGLPSGATGQREPGSGEAPESRASAPPGPSGSGPGSRGGVAARGLRVEFDGPRTRVTRRQVEPLTGKVVGGTPDRLALHVNEVPTDVVLGPGGAFEASVPLQPGLNRLRAVATGPGDARAEDSISIEYVPAAPGRIVLTSPSDGFVLGPDAPPVIVVEGQVEDKTVGTLWLVANDRRIPVKVSEGRFRKVVPLFAPVLRLWAETSRGGEPGSRSDPMTVYASGPRKPTGVLVMEWPDDIQGLDVEVSAVVRFSPDRLDGPTQTVRLPGVLKASDSAPFEVFWLRGVSSGAYTVTLRHRGAPPKGDLQATLYIPDKDGLATRRLPTVRLRPSGKTVLARVLLPYGVLWEQQDWFSGTSEGSDTVTKFRIPEGVSWVERRADLP